MMTALISQEEILLSEYDALPFRSAFTAGKEDIPASPIVWLFGSAARIGLISPEQSDALFNELLTFCQNNEASALNTGFIRNDLFILGGYLYSAFSRNRDRLAALMMTDAPNRRKAYEKLFEDAYAKYLSDLNEALVLAEKLGNTVRRLSSPFYWEAFCLIDTALETCKHANDRDSFVPLARSDIQVLYPLHRISEDPLPLPYDHFSYLKNLAAEVGICEKLGISDLQKEFSRLSKETESEVRGQIRKKEAMLAAKEERLEIWHRRQLDLADTLEERYNEELQKIEREDRAVFAGQHPELSVGDPEYEERFEAYQFSLPDSHFEVDLPQPPDPVAVERTYKKKKRQYEAERKALDAESERSLYEAWKSDFDDISLTLENTVRLRCLLLWSASGNHTVNMERSRFAEILESIPYDKAAHIVTAATPELTKEEKEYLLVL